MIFDLWDTIVFFDPQVSREFGARVAERLGRDPEEFLELWYADRPKRDSGALAEYLASIGADDGAVAELVAARHDVTRRLLVPREGTLETLAELRRRGLKLGMISVCSQDVPDVWAETSFADAFDVTVFSCSVGLRKPDPRIYRLALQQLEVDAADAIFVGDGANDELAGAERVGMKAVLVLRPGQDEPYWEEARGWQPRIHSIPEIVSVVDEEV